MGIFGNYWDKLGILGNQDTRGIANSLILYQGY